MKTIAPTIMSPTERNQAELKSGRTPFVNQKEMGCSDMSALVISRRKAELKNCTTKVTVVMFESC